MTRTPSSRVFQRIAIAIPAACRAPPATRREGQEQTTEDIPQHRDVERVGHRIVVLLKSDRVKAKNEKTREAGPAIDTKTAKSDEKGERASDLREFDRKPQRKMEPMHERNPKGVGTRPDEGDPIIRRSPIPMTGRAHIPERVVLRCASNYLFSPERAKV